MSAGGVASLGESQLFSGVLIDEAQSSHVESREKQQKWKDTIAPIETIYAMQNPVADSAV